jgi:hypothetical protein
MTTRRLGGVLAASAFMVGGVALQGQGWWWSQHIAAELEPEHEVPAVSSPASGRFSGEIHRWATPSSTN